MTRPKEHKTVQSRILAYAQEIGWRYVSRPEAERRRGFDPNGATPEDRAIPVSCVGSNNWWRISPHLESPCSESRHQQWVDKFAKDRSWEMIVKREGTCGRREMVFQGVASE